MRERTTELGKNGSEDKRVERMRDFLGGYQMGIQMLQLRQYERRRRSVPDPVPAREDLLRGNEAYWCARMHEVSNLINAMKNGREKMILYYHYVRGESIERASDFIGFSRRTGYRLHKKGLLIASFLLDKMKKSEEETGEKE